MLNNFFKVGLAIWDTHEGYEDRRAQNTDAQGQKAESEDGSQEPYEGEDPHLGTPMSMAALCWVKIE